MGFTGLYLLLLAFMMGPCEGCKLEACTRAFELALESAGIKSEASVAYCHELRSYYSCVKDTGKTCRGILQYHSATSLLNHLARRYNCTQHRGHGPRRPTPSPPPPLCTFIPSRPINYSHCGLFGDPHLKTFGGLYQTCRVRGAWPLIDNPYLAVQVTNMPVISSSPVTATTKVTVIIKGRSTNCATEKTYEATAESPLPLYFIDGTDQTGPDSSVAIKATQDGPNEKVQIYLRYIDTTIVIRRVGEYLGFSGRIPKEVLESTDNGEEMELCQHGCPSNEILDNNLARGHQLSWNAALAKCLDNSNLNNEIQNNLTDHYLDWCVFDVMTAGNQTNFISAAHSALADVLMLDPESLNNRTVPLELNQMPQHSKAHLPSPFASPIVIVFVYIFNEYFFGPVFE